MNKMIRVSRVFVASLLAACWIAACAQTDQADTRHAVVLAIEGKAYVVADGGQERPLKRGESLLAGASVRTDVGSKADLYFRQIGTVLRLMPGTSLKLEKLAKFSKDGVLLKETCVALPEGRLLCCVRLLVPDSRFEVRTPTTLFQMPAAGIGRYDIRSDGTVIVGKKSRVPLKALTVAPTAKTNLVSPGQQLDNRASVGEFSNPAVWEDLLMQFDEMQLIAESLTPPPKPEELPPKK